MYIFHFHGTCCAGVVLATLTAPEAPRGGLGRAFNTRGWLNLLRFFFFLFCTLLLFAR